MYVVVCERDNPLQGVSKRNDVHKLRTELRSVDRSFDRAPCELIFFVDFSSSEAVGPSARKHVEIVVIFHAHVVAVVSGIDNVFRGVAGRLFDCGCG